MMDPDTFDPSFLDYAWARSVVDEASGHLDCCDVQLASREEVEAAPLAGAGLLDEPVCATCAAFSEMLGRSERRNAWLRKALVTSITLTTVAVGVALGLIWGQS
jgi:hypothetical protein